MKTITVPRAENEKGVGSLLAHVLTLRWAMKQDVLENLLAVVARHDAGQRLEAAEVDAITHRLNRSRAGLLSLAPGEGTQVDEYGNPIGLAYTRVGSVAVVPIGGVIAKYSSQVNGSSQPRGTSTEHVMRGLAAAAADGKASSIMLLVDSPGGSVAGVSDLAEMIRQVGAVKPISSYAQDLAASAGLWITTQAKDRYANEGAMVGSLGVYTVLADVTKYHEQLGITLTLVSSGGVKGAMADGKVTPAVVDDVQREVNDYLGLFVRDVARGTGLSESHVKALADGRVHLAGDALKMGLLTKVMDLPGAIAEMEQKYGGRAAGTIHTSVSGRANNTMAAPAADGPLGGVARAGGSAALPAATQKGAPMKWAQVLRNAAGGEGGGGGGGEANPGVVATIPAPEKKADKKTEAVDVDAIAEKAARAEGKRIAAIDASAAPYIHLEAVKSLVADAKADTRMSVESFKARLLDAMTEGRKPLALSPSGNPGAGPSIGVGNSAEDRIGADMSVALAVQFAPHVQAAVAAGGENAEKVALAMGLESSKDVRTAIRRLGASGVRPTSLKACARAYLAAAGIVVPFDDAKLFEVLNNQDRRIVATHGTSDFPLMLANAMNKTLQASWVLANTVWENFCRIVPAGDYKAMSILRLAEMEKFKVRPEHAPNTYQSTNERREQLSVDAYSTGLKFTYQMLRNDDVGMIQQMLDGVRLSAEQLPDDTFFTALQSASGVGPTMADGLALFHATHGNLVASGTALSYTNLTLADTAFRTRSGQGNSAQKLGLIPEILLVPPALRVTAAEIIGSPNKPATGAESVNVQNAHQGMFRIVSSPKLTSSTAWYLAASANQAPPFYAAFLDGQRTAEITENVGQSDRMNMTFDAHIPGFGVVPVNFESIYRNPGA